MYGVVRLLPTWRPTASAWWYLQPHSFPQPRAEALADLMAWGLIKGSTACFLNFTRRLSGLCWGCWMFICQMASSVYLWLCSAFTGLSPAPHACLQKHHQALTTAEDTNRACTLLTASLCGTAFLSFIKMGLRATPAQCLCKGSPSSHNYCCLNDSHRCW